MSEIEIIDSKEERGRLINKVDVLDKVKALATLPGHGEATTQQVADFYEVDRVSAVDPVVSRHRSELESNGYRVVKGPELRKIKTDLQGASLLKQAKSVALWDRRAVLNLGMLLRDSEVAKEVRRYLLNAEEAVHQAVTNPAHSTEEPSEFWQAAAQALAGVLEPRFTSIENRLSQVEQAPIQSKPARKRLEAQRVPAAMEVAKYLQIPITGLTVGIARDGKPYGRYGNGKMASWVPRAQMFEAFNALS